MMLVREGEVSGGWDGMVGERVAKRWDGWEFHRQVYHQEGGLNKHSWNPDYIFLTSRKELI
jgi:hypothetical protein